MYIIEAHDWSVGFTIYGCFTVSGLLHGVFQPYDTAPMLCVDIRTAIRRETRWTLLPVR
jgi:hypothetical protein